MRSINYVERGGFQFGYLLVLAMITAVRIKRNSLDSFRYFSNETQLSRWCFFLVVFSVSISTYLVQFGRRLGSVGR